ncbi:Hypp6869 [Branchiostoma lanceolatum]|uniref:Hypp6869 protein n=1 Tax=Branchiostoma lanceolatum TaxID=7740 RepID=A0A8K0E7P9_BRALA|nr:Hypp6869 [Branchiostoma lanceolatum]
MNIQFGILMGRKEQKEREKKREVATCHKLDSFLPKKTKTAQLLDQASESRTLSRQGRTLSRQGRTLSRQGRTLSRQGRTLSCQCQTLSHQTLTVKSTMYHSL